MKRQQSYIEAGIACLMLTGIATIQGEPTALYRITPLTVGDAPTMAGDVNNSGTVLLDFETESGNDVYRFSGGVFSPLVGLGGTESHGEALNEHGSAVGYSTELGSNVERAVVFDDGGVIDLSLLLPDHPRSFSLGINGKEEVVGYYIRESDGVQRAFRFDGETAVDLGISPSGIASDVNAQGQIVGFERDSLNQLRAYIWADGAITLLPSLGGIRTSASAINNRGQITGNSQLVPNVPGHAFRFEDSQSDLIDLGTLDVSSQAFDLNHFGEVVGASFREGETEPRAFVHVDGEMLDLNQVVENGDGWVLKSARGINDHGQIVGNGILEGVSTAFLLTPLSNPRIDLYAGLTILGAPGDRFQVDYRDSVGGSGDWNPIETIELTGSVFLWVDEESPFVPKRFYRARPIE